MKANNVQAHAGSELLAGTTTVSRITASVVLYNNPESQLSRLLDCISRSSVPIVTYLIDNSPSAINFRCMHRSGVIYRRAAANRGYGAGHNIALREVLDEAQFHFVLNPDIYFDPEEMEKMLHVMQSDSSIGQLMPRVIYPDGSLQYLCKLVPTPADLFLRRFAVGPLRGIAEKRAEQFELRHTNYDKMMDVPYLSGCFMLFRTSALRQVGLFDERFFMYPEDIDITRRMHAEFRTVFFPGATVVHDHAKESYKSFRALRVHIWNSIKYFNKWGWILDPERTRLNHEVLRKIAIQRRSAEEPGDGEDATLR
jgi:GT2 family glycosyltransferase